MDDVDGAARQIRLRGQPTAMLTLGATDIEPTLNCMHPDIGLDDLGCNEVEWTLVCGGWSVPVPSGLRCNELPDSASYGSRETRLSDAQHVRVGKLFFSREKRDSPRLSPLQKCGPARRFQQQFPLGANIVNGEVHLLVGEEEIVSNLPLPGSTASLLAQNALLAVGET